MSSVMSDYYPIKNPSKLEEYLTEKDLGRLACVNRACSLNYSFKMGCGLPVLTRISDLESAIWPKEGKCAEKENALKQQFSLLSGNVYEKMLRGAANNNHGMVYPIFPEILKRAIELSKDEVVLEIAGASGENALLLAYSQASHVYMNDICPNEMKQFNKLKSDIPDSIKKKITPILGDCFDVLTKQPTLEGRVGLIMCRNFLHFVHPKNQTAFLRLVKKILKPGGRAIFTVNASYSSGFSGNEMEMSSGSAFCARACVLTDRLNGNTKTLYLERSPIEEIPDEDSTFMGYRDIYLYRKDADTGYKWEPDNDAFRQLEKTTRKNIKQIISREHSGMKKMLRGSVRVVFTYMRLFNFKKLLSIFRDAGFHIESSFGIGGSSHLVTREHIACKTPLIGLVVSRPRNESKG